ncbi:MAG: nicotinate-nucleotide--dimethylbenzimidazole phosphoribosyltransferase, partial [Candidatus Omnitrophica bacterium]|nr:nicotinate-nucleotide--dimethylbenzimidazole phosphoribosyltransferase [Candidatus Omnitrophota bacterium]
MKKISETAAKITALDREAIKSAQARLDSLTKPQASLGRLEELAKQVAGITGKLNPPLKNKVIFTLAADHGIAREGVSAFPQEVTVQMVYNFLRGGAGINVLARHVGARVVVADMGVAGEIQSSKFKAQNFKDKKVDFGTKNFTQQPAMTKDQAIKAICAGIEIFEEELVTGIDIAGTGDMGIANTASSSAIVASITGTAVGDVTGRGTGIDDKALQNKIKLLEQALKLHKPDAKDALDVLSKVGGFEIGGLAGIILAAAAHKVPVVIDGFISGAAALLAYTLCPKAKDYMIAAHCSVERGHRIALEFMGLEPILDLDLRLGEGTGAALAMNIVDAAVKIMNEMATFESA